MRREATAVVAPQVPLSPTPGTRVVWHNRGLVDRADFEQPQATFPRRRFLECPGVVRNATSVTRRQPSAAASPTSRRPRGPRMSAIPLAKVAGEATVCDGELDEVFGEGKDPSLFAVSFRVFHGEAS
jgi:hypothetical protein